MQSRLVSVGFGLLALAILAGAFGAHGLEARLDARGLELWETAARYLVYGALALVLLGLASDRPGVRSGLLGAGALSLLVGVVVFSGTVGALALGSARWLGAITPLGGLGMIVGLALAAVACWPRAAPS